MRILANENIPREAIEALRRLGHDVVWIRADAPGSSDQAIIARASAEERILITFDKDFGELVFRERLPASAGVVLFRISPSSPSQVAATAVEVLGSRGDWAGYFSVVQEHRLRMVPLPLRPEAS